MELLPIQQGNSFKISIWESICHSSPSKIFVLVVICHLQILMNASMMSVHTTERAPTKWEASNVNVPRGSRTTWVSDLFAKVLDLTIRREIVMNHQCQKFGHLVSAGGAAERTCSQSCSISPSSDVDECYNSTVCGPESECHNTLGSYTCTCKVGYAATNREIEPSQSNICIGVCVCFVSKDFIVKVKHILALQRSHILPQMDISY